MAPDSKRAKSLLLGSLIAASVRSKMSTVSENSENRVGSRTRNDTSGAGFQKLVFSFAWFFGSVKIHEF